MEALPDHEKIMVDVLRHIIIDHLPPGFKEKLSRNVPYFYINRGICMVWPASIKGGGIKHGVLLGFCYGFKLSDVDHYLIRGSNKKIYYKIYNSIEDIQIDPIVKLLHQAVLIDKGK